MTARLPSAPRTAIVGTSARRLDVDDDEFARRPSGRAELPDPERVLQHLTHCVIEVLAGARDLEQLARWVTDDV